MIILYPYPLYVPNVQLAGWSLENTKTFGIKLEDVKKDYISFFL